MSTLNRQLLTIDEFAAEVGLRPKTVRQWVWRRQIDTVRIGRSVRIPRAALDALIERGATPALTPAA